MAIPRLSSAEAGRLSEAMHFFKKILYCILLLMSISSWEWSNHKLKEGCCLWDRAVREKAGNWWSAGDLTTHRVWCSLSRQALRTTQLTFDIQSQLGITLDSTSLAFFAHTDEQRIIGLHHTDKVRKRPQRKTDTLSRSQMFAGCFGDRCLGVFLTFQPRVSAAFSWVVHRTHIVTELAESIFSKSPCPNILCNQPFALNTLNTAQCV